PNPAGLALVSPGRLWVAVTRANSLRLINLETGEGDQEVVVGVAPYSMLSPRPGRWYGSNWGGDPPKPGDPQAVSSDTPIRIDPRTGVANQGTISVVHLENGQWKQRKTIQVGLHPSGLAASAKGRFLYVANANSDTVSVIDTNTDQ